MFEFNSTFFWTLVNFLVLLFLVHKFALPSLYKILEEREQKRLQILEELEKNKNEAVEIQQKYKDQLENIHNEAKAILKDADQQREIIKKQILQDALQEKQVLLDNIKDALYIEKKRFITEMQGSAVDLVVHCTKKILQKELNVEEHTKIIRQNVNDLEKMIHI